MQAIQPRFEPQQGQKYFFSPSHRQAWRLPSSCMMGIGNCFQLQSGSSGKLTNLHFISSLRMHRDLPQTSCMPPWQLCIYCCNFTLCNCWCMPLLLCYYDVCTWDLFTSRYFCDWSSKAKAMFPHIWKCFYILETDRTWFKSRLC